MNKCLLCGFLAAMVPGPAFGQATNHPLTDKETQAIVAKCAMKLLKWPKLSLPDNWLGQGEKYRGSPLVTYFVAPDGSVHDVRLKKSSGARKLDKYATDVIRGWKYNPMPGCPGIETTASLTIDWNN